MSKNYGIQPTALKEKKEYTNVPTAAPKPRKADPGIEARLDVWMQGHNFPAGWQREIKSILKNVL